MRDFSGKTVLVTGGAGHIGRAICGHFLAEGANVVACGRRAPEQPIAADGSEAHFICADVRDPEASEATTGSPLAMASRLTFPKVSVSDGKKKTSALA